VLHGEYGTGKSFAAAYALYVLQRENLLKNWQYRTLWTGLKGLWVSAYRATTSEEHYEASRVTPILVLDDLGSEENTDRIRRKLNEIMYHRHSQRRITIITMRDDVIKMPDHYGMSMAEKVCGHGHTVYCGGERLEMTA
jgi:DNA replication protein DnaC